MKKLLALSIALILAGGAGIFFGITKSGQASELVEKAKTAETKAKVAQGKVTGLENDKKDLTAKFSTANSSAQSLQTQLDLIKENTSNKDSHILMLQADNRALNTQLQFTQLQMSELQAQADLGKQARDDLGRVQRGMATLEAELQKLKAPKKPKGPKGAEQISRHGLEGWGKKHGVIINVEDYSDIDKTFDVKAITNQVELKLRLAGIKISERYPKSISNDYILINMQPLTAGGGGRLTGYYFDIKPKRKMGFKYDGNDYIVFSVSKSGYRGASPPNYRQHLDKHLDELLLDYLKANPKPKEKKSLIEP